MLMSAAYRNQHLAVQLAEQLRPPTACDGHPKHEGHSLVTDPACLFNRHHLPAYTHAERCPEGMSQLPCSPDVHTPSTAHPQISDLPG